MPDSSDPKYKALRKYTSVDGPKNISNKYIVNIQKIRQTLISKNKTTSAIIVNKSWV